MEEEQKEKESESELAKRIEKKRAQYIVKRNEADHQFNSIMFGDDLKMT